MSVRNARALLTALVVTTAPALAWASEEAATHEPSLDGRGIFFKGINIAILFAILAYVLKGPVAAFFGGRRDRIAADLAAAEEARRQAQARLDEVDRKLSAAADEGAALLRKAEHEAQAEREQILSAARAEADRLRDVAQDDIRRAADLARAELRAYAAELAYEQATRVLEREIGGADQDRLLREYLERFAKVVPS